jgi:pentatricopeptide repeat protein
MINACVRAGETARAMQYLATMEAAGVAANEVTHTALIKGLAQDGDMAAVRDMLRTMRKNVRGSTVQYSAAAASAPRVLGFCHAMPCHATMQGLVANVRTYDTVLRGCVKCGDSRMALVIWGAMQKEVRGSGKSFGVHSIPGVLIACWVCRRALSRARRRTTMWCGPCA